MSTEGAGPGIGDFVLNSDFAFGKAYTMQPLEGTDHWVIYDDRGLAVAALPGGLGGEVRTRMERWSVNLERGHLGQVIVARVSGDGSEAARASWGLIPDTLQGVAHSRWRLPRHSESGYRRLGRERRPPPPAAHQERSGIRAAI